jgi:hypothetical protein
MNGELTVGGLVAFNMMMGQATQPILRLSQLWQDFQQVQISVERLGDIFNAAPESRQLGNAALPPAKGAIRIENLDFRYVANGPEVLKGVSIDIPEGQVIGIVQINAHEIDPAALPARSRPDSHGRHRYFPGRHVVAAAANRRRAARKHAVQPHHS